MLRAKRRFLVLTFATTEAALAAEAFCTERGLPGRLIPLPQSLSAGCGLAWRVPLEQAETLRVLAVELRVQQIAEVEML